METPSKSAHLSEEILTEILARVPLRSISRFKSVCKTWKSTLKSAYFRSLFLSCHKNSSCSWSLMSPSGTKQFIGFYGCEPWDLEKSLASFMPPLKSFEGIHKVSHKASSNGLVLFEERSEFFCYVGNPILKQWVKIPPPTDSCSFFGLVTSVDEDDVVLSFKVVRLSSRDHVANTMSVFVYSSNTGIWSSKLVHGPCEVTNHRLMTLNSTIYLYNLSEPGVFLAHDFYSESNQFRVVHYPDHSSNNTLVRKRSLTSSGGFVVYIKTLARKEETEFRVWRLNNDESWQLLREFDVPTIGHYVPMAMHPFDSDIVYLWSLHYRHLILCNLRMRNYRIVRNEYKYNDDHHDHFVDYSAFKMHMYEIWGRRPESWDSVNSIEVLSQFVLPRWMDAVPCPPAVEMMDTTSLLSYMQKTTKRNRGDVDQDLVMFVGVVFFRLVLCYYSVF